MNSCHATLIAVLALTTSCVVPNPEYEGHSPDADVEPDTDADTDGDRDTDADAPIEGVRGVITSGCDSGHGDVWSFDVAVRDKVFARVDTIASETASDLFLVIFKQLESPRASRIIRSDDQFDCTYPPPEFQCPEAEAEVPDDARDVLYVYVGIAGGGPGGACANENLSEYQLLVTVNDEARELNLEADELRWPN